MLTLFGRLRIGTVGRFLGPSPDAAEGETGLVGSITPLASGPAVGRKGRVATLRIPEAGPAGDIAIDGGGSAKMGGGTSAAEIVVELTGCGIRDAGGGEAIPDMGRFTAGGGMEEGRGGVPIVSGGGIAAAPA